MAIYQSNLHCGAEQPLGVGTARTRTNKAKQGVLIRDYYVACSIIVS